MGPYVCVVCVEVWACVRYVDVRLCCLPPPLSMCQQPLVIPIAAVTNASNDTVVWHVPSALPEGTYTWSVISSSIDGVVTVEDIGRVIDVSSVGLGWAVSAWSTCDATCNQVRVSRCCAVWRCLCDYVHVCTHRWLCACCVILECVLLLPSNAVACFPFTIRLALVWYRSACQGKQSRTVSCLNVTSGAALASSECIAKGYSVPSLTRNCTIAPCSGVVSCRASPFCHSARVRLFYCVAASMTPLEPTLRLKSGVVMLQRMKCVS